MQKDRVRDIIDDYFDKQWYDAPNYQIRIAEDAMSTTKLYVKLPTVDGDNVFSKTSIQARKLEARHDMVEQTVRSVINRAIGEASERVTVGIHDVHIVSVPTFQCKCMRCKKEITMENYSVPLRFYKPTELAVQPSDTLPTGDALKTGDGLAKGMDSQIGIDSTTEMNSQTKTIDKDSFPRETIREWLLGYFVCEDCRDWDLP